MNKKFLTLLLAGGCVILILAAVLLYSALSGKVDPSSPLISASSGTSDSATASSSGSSSTASVNTSSESSSESESDDASSSASSSSASASVSSSHSSSKTSASSSKSSSSSSSSSSKSSSSSSSSSSSVPTLPVSFTVYTESGSAVSLASKAGKPIVVNYWASWCGYCKYEMPDFQSVYNEYGSRVNFMMINTSDTVENGKAYITENGFTFPVYYDTYYSAASAFSVPGLPTTVIIDRSGTVIYHQAGAMSASMLRQVLNTALN